MKKFRDILIAEATATALLFATPAYASVAKPRHAPADVHKVLPFAEMVAWLRYGAPTFTRELQRDFHQIDSAPFNAFSIATLGGGCTSQGSVLFQSAGGVSKCLGAGTAGQVVTSGGPGADLIWAPDGAAASIGITTTSIVGGSSGNVEMNNAGKLGEYSISGTGSVAMTTNPVFTTPNLGTPSALALANATGAVGANFGSQSANLHWASPNGSSGVPTWRAAVAADFGASIGAGTFLGNSSASAAAPAFQTFNSLTDISAIATADEFAAWQSASGAMRKVSASEIAAGLPFLSTLTNAVSRTAFLKMSDIVSVKDFGALGNSNGTTGNGQDDTTYIQNAINNSPSRSVFFPCGTYRITATLTMSSAGQYRLYGLGPCSQIFNDLAAAGNTIAATPAAPCSSANIPCVVIDGMTFIAATQTGTGDIAVNASNNQGITLTHDIVVGNNVGFALATSYGPIIKQDTIYNMLSTAIFVPSTDASLNAGDIESNKIYGNGISASSAAMAFGTSNGGLIFRGNDIEGNYAGIVWAGAVTGADVSFNYLETQTSFDMFWNAAFTASKIQGNRIGSGKTTSWNGIQDTDISGNDFGGGAGTITIAASADVHDNAVDSGNTLATNFAAPTSCGTSPVVSALSTDESGSIVTGSSNVSACSIAWKGSYTNAPKCAFGIGAGNATFAGNASNTGIGFGFTLATSLPISWICKFSN